MHFAARDWEALTETFADDSRSNDRRRVDERRIHDMVENEDRDLRAPPKWVSRSMYVDCHRDPWRAPRPHVRAQPLDDSTDRVHFTTRCSG